MLEDGKGRALPELKLKLEDSSKAVHLRVVEEIVEDTYIYEHLRLCIGLGCRTQDRDGDSSRREMPIDHEILYPYVIGKRKEVTSLCSFREGTRSSAKSGGDRKEGRSWGCTFLGKNVSKILLPSVRRFRFLTKHHNRCSLGSFFQNQLTMSGTRKAIDMMFQFKKSSETRKRLLVMGLTIQHLGSQRFKYAALV